jgi:hypothetical protein
LIPLLEQYVPIWPDYQALFQGIGSYPDRDSLGAIHEHIAH